MKLNILKTYALIGFFILIVGNSINSALPTTIITDFLKDGSSLFYVGGSGSGNYTKIQDAIDNASDGDIVFVYDDSSPYYENILLEKSIQLIGERKETTIIDADKSFNVITIFADGVTVSGFTIQHSGILVIDSGIEIHSSHNAITGNIISNNSHGIFVYPLYGISADYNSIIDNQITFNDESGIYLYHSNYNLITKNILSNNAGVVLDESDINNISANVFENDGILLSDFSNNLVISNNLVNGKPLVYMIDESDKNIDNAGQIILADCHNITIQHQNLSNTITGLMLLESTNCHIMQNTISNNRFFGINIYQSNNNNISMNTLTHNSAGLRLFYSNQNVVIWNTIKLNQPYNGIELYISNNNTISTNIIQNNGGRFMVEHGLGLFLSTSSDNQIEYNNFLKNARDAYFNDAYRNNWNSNYWNRPRVLPKIIFGEKWRLNFDWHPAQEPYDILEMS